MKLICQSDIVHEFACRICSATYIDKTMLTFYKKSYEHSGTDASSAIIKYIDEYNSTRYLLTLNHLNLFPTFFQVMQTTWSHVISLIQDIHCFE